MTESVVAVKPESKPTLSVISSLATKHGMEKDHFVAALKATVVPGTITDAQFAAFCMVAAQYNLNPLTKEIYAFPGKGCGIVPIVSIDGWCNIINSNPQLDGIEFDDDVNEAGKLISITCKISRKDRKLPVECTEYMAECAGTSEPWKRWPARMLRHKALIQCARYAFGLSGIVDPDEAERMDMIDVTPLVKDQKTGEMVKAGPSPFKNSSERNKFCASVKESLEKAQNSETLEIITAKNAAMLNAMRMSASNFDIMGEADIALALEIAEDRIGVEQKLLRQADAGNFEGGEDEAVS